MSTAAIYLRLSSEDYEKCTESASIVNQRNFIRSYIAGDDSLKEYDIREYVDDGYSGTSMNRPAFLRLLDDIKSSKVNTVIVKDMSRFSRDYILLGDYLENIFPFLKVRFISINDGYDSLREAGNGIEIDTQFKTLFYDLYSRELSEKVINANTHLKAQGKNINWAAPFGYIKDPNNKHHIIVDKETAFIVREAFELLLKGYSCRDIANIFNEKGYITRSGRKEVLKLNDYSNNLKIGYSIGGRLWTSVSISQMTSNELYTGDYVYNKYRETHIGGRKNIKLPENEWKKVPNTHEAIISREIFDKVKEVKKSKTLYKDTKSKKRLFSKKIFCRECGRTMIFRSNSRKSRKSDIIYHYKSYYCYLCKAIKLPNNIKEQSIIDFIKPRLETFKTKSTQTSKKTKDNIKVEESINREISMLNNKLQKIYESYKQNELSKEEYLKQKSLLMDKREEVESKQRAINASKEINIVKEIDITDEESLLKEYVGKYIDKIIVSRSGEIEIIEK